MSVARQDLKAHQAQVGAFPPRAARRKRRTDRRGVALVMVLGAITVLTVFLTELQEETSSELSSALAERDAVRAEYFARSAVNLSRLLIAMEPNIRKGNPLFQMLAPQLPVWKYQDTALGSFNDAESGKSFSSLLNADPSTGKNLGLSGGHFELTIVDEDSKININTAAQNDASTRVILEAQLLGLMSSQEYNTLFEGRDLDNQFSNRQIICGALIDWADSSNAGNEDLDTCDPTNDRNTTTGTEDNFYQMIGLGYQRKNAAYDSLQELRLVRGISDDFWATFIEPDPSNPDKRNVTVWGQGGQVGKGGKGPINVTTANAQTLLGVICSDKEAGPTFCADPTQVVAFLQLVTMAQAILPPGVPLFNSGNDLVGFLTDPSGQAPKKGKSAQMPSVGSMVLPMLTPMLPTPLKAVKFQNGPLLAKQFGNTSKIFSIYADGVVPGFRKTTKVRIHAVVDFGSRPEVLGEAFSAISGGGNGAQIPAAALDALKRSDPAGNVIYWRVE
jgi:general secretion pathway protein K